jgi:hypothetical protein
MADFFLWVKVRVVSYKKRGNNKELIKIQFPSHQWSMNAIRIGSEIQRKRKTKSGSFYIVFMLQALSLLKGIAHSLRCRFKASSEKYQGSVDLILTYCY